MSATAKNVLVSYDITKDHVKFKATLKSNGYMDNWNASQKTYYLPNTTLWKQNTTVAQAFADLQAVSKQLGLALERALAVNFEPSDWAAIEGKTHTQ